MTVDDSLHCCQTDAASLELIGTVQPLKRSEQLLRVIHVEANAVIADKVDVFAGAHPVTQPRPRPLPVSW